MTCRLCDTVRRVLGWSKVEQKDTKVKTAPVSTSSKKPANK